MKQKLYGGREIDTVVTVRASAEILPKYAGFGRTADRVIVRRAVVASMVARDPSGNRARAKRRKRPANGVQKFKADRSTRGKGSVQVIASMPASERDALDAIATRVQMSRSHFIRQAVKHFAVKVLPPPEPRDPPDPNE